MLALVRIGGLARDRWIKKIDNHNGGSKVANK